MSGDGKVSFEWGDGLQVFQLKLGEIRELQEKTGIGPHKLYDRLLVREWLVDDPREILRLGLIGGGASPVEALSLVNRYCFPVRPMVESLPAAIAVLGAALVGVPDDPILDNAPKKPPRRRAKKTAVSPSPPSMPAAGR